MADRLRRAGIVMLFVGASAGAISRSGAQGVNDPDFHFRNAAPAFPDSTGPVVCLDEAHNNAHTLEGRFSPMAAVLESDGFRVRSSRLRFTRAALEACDILISPNALDSANAGEANWQYPHLPAFQRDELNALVLWIRRGGALLVFADHAPFAGASADLGYLVGVAMTDAWAYNTPRGMTPEMLRRSDGAFHQHPILDGRSAADRIDSIATWVAQAFLPSDKVEPLLSFGPDAAAYVLLGEMGQQLKEVPEEEWPRFSVQGWLAGASRRWGEGRVLVLGDISGCTAQRVGADGTRVGMNHPQGAQNAQFCLNAVRWLGRVLD